jgi:hypothetical protein
MVSAIVKFLLLAGFLYATVNWFALQQYPQLAQYVGHELTLYSSMGISAGLMVLSLFFGKGR